MKKTRWSKIKRPEMIIQLDKPYIGGEIRGADFILELPKRKKITILKTSKKRNPDRLHLFTIPMKDGSFSIVHYKNENTFKAFYRGGVHTDSTSLSESYLYRMLRNILYSTTRRKKLTGQASRSMDDLMEKNIGTIKSWRKPFDINKARKNVKRV